MPLKQAAHTLIWRSIRPVVALAFVLSLAAPAGDNYVFSSAIGSNAESPTGFTLAPEFVQFYDTHSGLALFGYAISPPRIEGSNLVQWTERQRLEWHPENRGANYEVLLGLLGRELTRGFDGPSFSYSEDRTINSEDAIFFPQTKHEVTEPFAGYWRQHGGLPVFGYPISTRHTDENGLEIQWFERARFEYHPELPAPHKVLLGHLGLEAQRRLGIPRYELEVGLGAAPDTSLQVDLAQGGESDAPAFFDNARSAASELGPGLVRLDNIFNYYHIVQRGTAGGIHYQWSQFDRILDGVIAMGKTPMISLSYMPETISANGHSRILPPLDYDEWSRLVHATVKHVNIDRKLGVRYWEVWNEPNEWSFWQGSYPDYLRLYDMSVEAARRADPSIAIGGPALSRFSADHLSEFFKHEVSQGTQGQIDFISWHSYGQSPSEIADDIRRTREIAANYPQFSPELFITEFNVLQGSGDTSAHAHTDKVEGAIALLRAIESMQRERLDRAFLFELKDGQGPSRYWGRWGILTNDASPKPIYHALKAYRQRPSGSLPVRLTKGDSDNLVGLMAYGGPKKATLLLWYTGDKTAAVKISLPSEFAALKFDRLLFDVSTNNPSLTGDASLNMNSPRHAGDLVFELKPGSLVILTSR